MPEILDNAFQKAIEEQGTMEDQKRKQAPAIDSVIATRPDLSQLPKLGKKDAATDERANAVQETSPELSPNPTKSSENTDATAIVANDPKQTKLGENDAVIEATAPEAKATASDVRANPVKATAAEPNPDPTKLTENDAVTDATAPMAENSEAMAMAPDSIPAGTATQENGISASQDEVSQPPSVDQMLQDLKKG
jgi:hypothetical protein